MLAKTFRFHGHEVIRRVYKQGQAQRSRLGSVHVLKNDRSKTTHVAVVVSRKVDKSAVVRNRIRRRIYELVRHSDITKAVGMDMVITIQKVEAATLSHEELEKEINILLQKVGPSS